MLQYIHKIKKYIKNKEDTYYDKHSDYIKLYYVTWKKLGYQVKKGEKSEHKIPVWKPSTKKVEVENEDGTKEEKTNGRYFIKTSAFFTQEQVERIEK